MLVPASVQASRPSLPTPLSVSPHRPVALAERLASAGLLPQAYFEQPLIVALGSLAFICCLPWLANQAGIHFGVPLTDWADLTQTAAVPAGDAVHRLLRGSFIHSLLEWSAFSVAIFIVALAFVRFSLTKDVVSPIVGLALFFAGCMDAFHTLAADRLIDSVADNADLVPFTWAICRLFNALITATGAIIVLLTPAQYKTHWKLPFILILGSIFGLIAYTIVQFCATFANLPETTFPQAWIKRPWDFVPLLIFAFNGLLIYPRLYQHHPSQFSRALVVGSVADVATQAYMTFGSEALFDNGFMIGHSLKIIAYLIPFIGLCLDYVDTYRKEIAALEDLQRSELALQEKTQQLGAAFSALKNTQMHLVQSEKMSSLGQLVTGVAHEINNPINFIYGNLTHVEDYSQTLLQGIDLYARYTPNPHADLREQLAELDLDYVTTDLPKILSSMRMGADRIRHLVLSLRNISRTDDLAVQSYNVHEGIDSTLLILQHRLKARPGRAAIDVVRNYGQLSTIDCYPGPLNQVFMNILANAIDELETVPLDATRPTHQIRITTSSHLSPESGSSLQIRISDNGSGISPEVLPHIFETFYTTKPIGKGTGLGLSISHQIITVKHRGKLCCFSEPGKGTEFLIELPCKLMST